MRFVCSPDSIRTPGAAEEVDADLAVAPYLQEVLAQEARISACHVLPARSMACTREVRLAAVLAALRRE